MSERNLNKHCKQNVGWDKFKDVFMVSSKHGDGINDVKVSCFDIFIYYNL